LLLLQIFLLFLANLLIEHECLLVVLEDCCIEIPLHLLPVLLAMHNYSVLLLAILYWLLLPIVLILLRIVCCSTTTTAICKVGGTFLILSLKFLILYK
jgi:hypothetical protein